ncbi:HAD-like domain containing protein [Cryptosporidium felis]|nr:HAD-like domain containing protein [Cryptosporidium felis]
MPVGGSTSQDVKLGSQSDLDGVSLEFRDDSVDEYLDDNCFVESRQLSTENSEHVTHDRETESENIESCEKSGGHSDEMENFTNKTNIFDKREASIPKYGSEMSLDCDLIAENTSEEFGRIIMLDLDNTLIPTNWIMQTWRNIQCEMGNEGDSIDYNEDENSLYELTEQIRSELVNVGLFDLLEKFFSDLWGVGRAMKIVIVTNAGLRTVELFYLKYCLPKLGDLLSKYNIEIKSTEEYIRKKGPPPSPFREEEYREFYTNAKLSEFQRVLLDCWENSKDHPEAVSMFDIISAGDQACEMTAACRISKFYENKIRRTKLIYINDPENLRFWKQRPEGFIVQLEETRRELLNLLIDDSETLIGSGDMNSTGLTNLEEGNDEELEEVSLGWCCRGKYINIAISKPERFVLPQGGSEMYLDAEKDYLGNK